MKPRTSLPPRLGTASSNAPIGLIALLGVATICLVPLLTHAQILRGRLRQTGPQVEAVIGEPYGVGRWTVDLPAGTNPALLGNSGFTLTEKNGRVLYQAFQAEPVRAVAREFLGRPQQATVYFLFTGDEPLELQLFAPTARSISVTPRREPVEHSRLLSDWWVKYARQANRITRPADYPDLVDNYLLSMLSRRLGLPPASEVPPPAIRALADTAFNAATGSSVVGGLQSGDEQLDHSLAVLFGGDDLRSRLQVQALSRRTEIAEPADQSLPPGIDFQLNVPEVLGEVAIEPIATHVPKQCFYVRFGNFTNYLWFRRTMDRWSGDLQNLVSRRGMDFGMTARTERQLSLKESALAEILGPAVIVDVAMIGTDTFFREGPAMGILFQARNNFALASDFSQQRSATQKREANCTQKQVTISGRQVSFLSTPDNRVRSFYATDGDLHLVTNSRYLVEQFFAAGANNNSLGSSAEFKLARSLMPQERNDTVFAYLSAEFFRNLAGSHYQIEMFRRMRSAAELDVALVAELAARAGGQGETNGIKSIEELIAAGFLPPGFGDRSDGSRIGRNESGELVDSLRGPRGAFVPVPDMPVEKATATEVQDYEKFAEWFRSKWTQFDPVVAGIRSQSGKTAETERIVIDAQLTPLALKNYETLAAALGPMSNQKLAPIPGDIASIEIAFSGNLLASKGVGQPQGAYRFFAGVRDTDPSVEVLGGGSPSPAPAPPSGPLAAIGNVSVDGVPLSGLLGGLAPGGGMAMLPPYYFGATPTPAIFKWLGVGEVRLDANGFGRSQNGMWQRREGPFTTASPSREILETVTPQLRFVEAPRPGQAWVHIGDLSQSRLKSTINGLFYAKSKSAGVGNLQFLHSLSTQLRVPPEDCLKVAEQLADARFTCPLGGKYELKTQEGTLPTWTSTSLPADRMRVVDGLMERAPADFTAPILTWLRELTADLSLNERTLALHAEVEMVRATPAAPDAAGNSAKPSLPTLPKLPSLFPSGKTPPPAAEPPAEELPPPTPRPSG